MTSFCVISLEAIYMQEDEDETNNKRRPVAMQKSLREVVNTFI
jgi:hypothetical protein